MIALQSTPSRHDHVAMDPGAAVTVTQRSNTTGLPANFAGSSATSQHSEHAHALLLQRPFELRHGRRFLREVPYPLPCDLPETHRQNLRTHLACKVFDRPFCSPNALAAPPTKVLEVGCGGAYWSSRCHEFFFSLGYKHVSFTGLDLAPLAGDLRKQGIDWNFIQHDFRRFPWPVDDGEFDFVMCKDLSLAIPLGNASQHFLDECIRLLRPGGTLEIWESDHLIKSLSPQQLPSRKGASWEQEVAAHTGTFPVSPSVPFAHVHNKYLKAANNWISEALDARKLPSMPCGRVASMLLEEPHLLGDVRYRRIAVPLGELRWEEENRLSEGKGKGKASRKTLSAEQLALRRTALLTVVQMIEGLEPILRQVSGKNIEEWRYWWASMLTDLMDPSRKPLAGECIELGAWWARKLGDEDL